MFEAVYDTNFNVKIDIPDTDLRDDDIKQIVSKALKEIVDPLKWKDVSITVEEINLEEIKENDS